MDKMEEYGFFAMIDRMQYIGRWALMRNSRTENIKEHSFDVAVIAHCLTILHNKFEKDNEGAILPDPYKVQAYALYHDCTDIGFMIVAITDFCNSAKETFIFAFCVGNYGITNRVGDTRIVEFSANTIDSHIPVSFQKIGGQPDWAVLPP